MATGIETPRTNSSAEASAESRFIRAGVFVLTVVLCVVCCGLMLMLNPGSLAVDSVYQGF